MNNWNDNWRNFGEKIKKIEQLWKIAEESEDVNLEKSKELIEEALSGKIKMDVIELEVFLKEVIKQGKN